MKEQTIPITIHCFSSQSFGFLFEQDYRNGLENFLQSSNDVRNTSVVKHLIVNTKKKSLNRPNDLNKMVVSCHSPDYPSLSLI